MSSNVSEFAVKKFMRFEGAGCFFKSLGACACVLSATVSLKILERFRF